MDWFNNYIIHTLGSPGRVAVESGRQLTEAMNSYGGAIVGTPDDAIAAIHDLTAWTKRSHAWTLENKERLMAGTQAAIVKAMTDAGVTLPDGASSQ
jgi:hypothetical protein